MPELDERTSGFQSLIVFVALIVGIVVGGQVADGWLGYVGGGIAGFLVGGFVAGIVNAAARRR